MDLPHHASSYRMNNLLCCWANKAECRLINLVRQAKEMTGRGVCICVCGFQCVCVSWSKWASREIVLFIHQIHFKSQKPKEMTNFSSPMKTGVTFMILIFLSFFSFTPGLTITSFYLWIPVHPLCEWNRESARKKSQERAEFTFPVEFYHIDMLRSV